jgi:tRNA pseudouridine55 synthase
VDGVLLIDKPSGPTSHDVVARVRSVSRERSVGHTGTLDPRATGLLALVLGKATRLASVLSGTDKTYDATIRLGSTTDTDDADGSVIATSNVRPDDAAMDAALGRFRGTFEQLPPNHSAKKVGGHKAYDLARRAAPIALAPVPVTVRTLHLTRRDGDIVSVLVTASAGFYVRALARDLGQALGCGAHLESLRRTAVGRFDVAQALPLDAAERLGQSGLASHILSPADALGDFPSVTVNADGLRRVLHGNPLSPQHLHGRALPSAGSSPATRIRVLADDGHLVALAASRGGALHPTVVLG